MRLRNLIVLALLLAGLSLGGWKAAEAVRDLMAVEVTETPSTRVKRGPVTITVTARGELQGGKPEMLAAPMVGSDTLAITDLRSNGELVNEGDARRRPYERTRAR